MSAMSRVGRCVVGREATQRESTQRDVCRWPVCEHGERVADSVAGCRGSVALTDVTFGDVWYCAGQSNMWLPLKYTYARNALSEAPHNCMLGGGNAADGVAMTPVDVAEVVVDDAGTKNAVQRERVEVAFRRRSPDRDDEMRNFILGVNQIIVEN